MGDGEASPLNKTSENIHLWGEATFILKSMAFLTDWHFNLLTPRAVFFALLLGLFSGGC